MSISEPKKDQKVEIPAEKKVPGTKILNHRERRFFRHGDVGDVIGES